ncbi:hypothetical protein CERSUDRAFT_84626 [Gelatoporia subvermispora B]|uniref:DUF6534 domain-containing protein n=1 Tax=Ceriporiopsis subvermispora (strain B) TaxID=914234 RepID=M2PJT0_CERS8|nr:hypothetical protein CERSUDRAFT_84626 [Gelatoporia subvermispora B]
MASPLVQLDLDGTLGAAFLGNLAAAIFYGITNVQTYLYYKRNVADSTVLKSIVFFLWVLDSLHLALISHALYTYAVTNFANPLAIMVPTWSIMAHVAVTGVSDVFVRSLFCQRVWKLSGRNWVLTIAIIISSLVTFAGSVAFSIRGLQIDNFFAFSEISWILYTSFGLGVAADLLIAVSLVTFLQRRRTGFSRTDSVVRVLMLYSINTGALTTLCAFLCLVMYATMPDNFIFIAFYFVLPKLFLNSLLATLNARRSLRLASMSGLVSIPLSKPTASRSTASVRPEFTSQERDDQFVEIQVHTATEIKSDSTPDEYLVSFLSMRVLLESMMAFWQDRDSRKSRHVSISNIVTGVAV